MGASNNVSAFPTSAAQVACTWVARLDRGHLTPGERQALAQWIAEHPSHLEELARQLRQWLDLDVLRELNNLGLATDGRQRTSWFRRWLAMPRPALSAAGAIAVALVGVALIGASNNWEVWKLPAADGAVVDLGISTSVGEHTDRSLPDGSVVHVNTASTADIDYTPAERSVHLHKGEAYFEVAKDKHRPFVVYAADTTVKAVGTAFSVHIDDGAVTVAVTEGSVEFTSAGRMTVIAAVQDAAAGRADGKGNGNVAVIDDGQLSVSTMPDSVLNRRLAWQEGMLEFRGDRLDYVVKEISRYTQSRIVIVDDDIKAVPVGGYFKVGDVAGLVSTLQKTFNVHADYVSSNLIYLSRSTSH